LSTTSEITSRILEAPPDVANPANQKMSVSVVQVGVRRAAGLVSEDAASLPLAALCQCPP
jgi:hypothetical protein